MSEAAGLDEKVRERLLRFGESIPAEELTPTLVPEAARLTAQDAFAFILAAALDRGMKAEVAWTIPYWLKHQLGHLDPVRIASMALDEIARALSRLPMGPRYTRDAPRTVLELAGCGFRSNPNSRFARIGTVVSGFSNTPGGRVAGS